MRKQNFSLIELLVVIAVISILAALLLPALNSARETAKQTQCINQEKQLVLGIASYCSDADDHFPIIYRWATDHYWGDKMYRGKYIPNVRLLSCPSYAKGAFLPSRGVVMAENDPNWKFTQYGMNWELDNNVSDGYSFARTGMVKNPSRKFLLSDSVAADTSAAKVNGDGVNVYGFARVVPARWTSSGQGVVLARHRQLRTCTVAWIDGHISTLVSPVPGYDAIAYFYTNHLKQFRNFRPQD